MTPKFNKHRTPWQRLLLSLFGIGIIFISWRLAVNELRVFPEPAIASFTTITIASFYTVAAIVIFMVTGRLVYEWKMNTAQQITEIGEQLVSKEEHVPAPKQFDNGSIP